MKNYILKAALAGSLLASSALIAPVVAEEEDTSMIPGEFSGNVALTTNYLFRGEAQSGDDPAISGGFDYSYGIFYAGTWASSLGGGVDPSMEIDFYAGVAPEWNGVAFDIGVIYYGYPDSADGPDLDFIEYYVGAGYTFGEFLDVGASIAYSDDFFAETGEAWYYSASAGIPLGPYFGLDGSIGFSDLTDPPGLDADRTDWSIGITTEFEGFGLDLRYIDTDADGDDPASAYFGLEDSYDEHFVFTISRSL